jgi:hypothetical protein
VVARVAAHLELHTGATSTMLGKTPAAAFSVDEIVSFTGSLIDSASHVADTIAHARTARRRQEQSLPSGLPRGRMRIVAVRARIPAEVYA